MELCPRNKSTPATRLHDRIQHLLNMPELNIVMFAFLLNFVWEFLQVPFFENMKDAPHWQAVKHCTVATIGDAAIMLIAYWCVAAFDRTRSWVLKPQPRQIAGIAVVGVVISILLEILNTKFWDRWEYSSAMPVIPLLEIGAVPLLQWIVLPPLTVWFVHRQLT